MRNKPKQRSRWHCSPENMLALFWEYQCDKGGDFIDWCQSKPGIGTILEVRGDGRGGLKFARLRIKR